MKLLPTGLCLGALRVLWVDSLEQDGCIAVLCDREGGAIEDEVASFQQRADSSLQYWEPGRTLLKTVQGT